VVRTDPGGWQFQAFGDLTGNLSWHVTPDRQCDDETRIVSEVGAWVGSAVKSTALSPMEAKDRD
jgi:hypothetical protein